MRFLPLYLYANQQSGTDPLGNPINELVQTGESVGRFSSWTAEEIALDVRQITQNNRKIVTRAMKEALTAADKIKFEDLYYSITEIQGDDTTRWRIVVVNRYGSETA
ncbi:phage head closure protein [Sporolactobacillus shoreicorticis]|uniref:Phage head closure protein n=1 Tax=Sporolactobacillus shoreicorticis TaxID=1923877 RepID=A0ABW5S0F0_9BACL|nr:phage head closure protein [Sporolactobacillus shoreicorticis]MCO7125113.1 phage head closure protein [Sporolactobacillus shoreicorticis]